MKLALNLLLAIMTAVTLAFGVGCGGGGDEAAETEAPAEQATGGEETAPVDEAAPPAEEAPANPCGEAGNPCGEAAP